MNCLKLINILLFCLLFSCGGDRTTPEPPRPPTQESQATFNLEGFGVVKATLLSDNGGRVAWYTGTAGHNLIAYDAVSNWYDLGGGLYDKRTDIYLMAEDGSSKRCLTCQSEVLNNLHDTITANRSINGINLPGFFLGQPSWHPDGVHIIIQVENINSPHKVYNFQSFGLDNDLWILNINTLSVRKILAQNNTGNAFLHPQFSSNGNKLIFSARNNGGLYGNHWDKWYLAVASFDITESAENMISNISYIQPNGRGFYETTGFIGTSQTDFSYSFTAYDANTLSVPPYVDDGYITNVSGSFTTAVVELVNFWDEKPRYSPSGNYLVTMSNRLSTDWNVSDGVTTLSTELFIGPPGGTLIQLTDFKSLNRYKDLRLLITDHEWNTTGDKMVVQIQPAGLNNDTTNYNAHIWLLELPQSF